MLIETYNLRCGPLERDGFQDVTNNVDDVSFANNRRIRRSLDGFTGGVEEEFLCLANSLWRTGNCFDNLFVLFCTLNWIFRGQEEAGMI